jgi:hypothetical protein
MSKNKKISIFSFYAVISHKNRKIQKTEKSKKTENSKISIQININKNIIKYYKKIVVIISCASSHRFYEILDDDKNGLVSHKEKFGSNFILNLLFFYFQFLLEKKFLIL